MHRIRIRKTEFSGQVWASFRMPLGQTLKYTWVYFFANTGIYACKMQILGNIFFISYDFVVQLTGDDPRKSSAPTLVEVLWPQICSNTGDQQRKSVSLGRMHMQIAICKLGTLTRFLCWMMGSKPIINYFELLNLFTLFNLEDGMQLMWMFKDFQLGGRWPWDFFKEVSETADTFLKQQMLGEVSKV